MRVLWCLLLLLAVSGNSPQNDVEKAIQKLEHDLGELEEEEVRLPWCYEGRAQEEIDHARLEIPGVITVEQFANALAAEVTLRGWMLEENCQHLTHDVLRILGIDIRRYPDLQNAITQRASLILSDNKFIHYMLQCGAYLNNWLWPTTPVVTNPCGSAVNVAIREGHGGHPLRHRGRVICSGHYQIMQATIHWRDSWFMSAVLSQQMIALNHTLRTDNRADIPAKVYHAYVVLDAIDPDTKQHARIQVERRHHVGVSAAETVVSDVPIFSVKVPDHLVPSEPVIVDPITQQPRGFELPPAEDYYARGPESKKER